MKTRSFHLPKNPLLIENVTIARMQQRSNIICEGERKRGGGGERRRLEFGRLRNTMSKKRNVNYSELESHFDRTERTDRGSRTNGTSRDFLQCNITITEDMSALLILLSPR